jgi:hypothetical protein
MDMVERVAEKLKLTYAASTFMPIPNAETGLWQDMARAAIEAMREPTEAMIEARKRQAGHWHVAFLRADHRRRIHRNDRRGPQSSNFTVTILASSIPSNRFAHSGRIGRRADSSSCACIRLDGLGNDRRRA